MKRALRYIPILIVVPGFLVFHSFSRADTSLTAGTAWWDISLDRGRASGEEMLQNIPAILEANRKLASARMAADSAQLKGLNQNQQTALRAAPDDQNLAAPRFDDLSGKPIVALINFAVHPTIVRPFTVLVMTIRPKDFPRDTARS